MSSLSSSSTPSGPETTVHPPAEPHPAPRAADERTPIQRALHFERYTAWPVFLFSILFFAATFTLLSGSIHDQELIRLTQVVAVVSYALVLLDFLIRMVLARKAPRAFFRRYVFELLSLLVPLLRPFVIIIYLWRLPSFQRSGATLRARLLITTFLFMFMYVYLISSVVWLVERHTPGANIVNLDDAIWWGFATLSTVGYGDFVPITATGRVLAVGLMIGGIAIVGTTTALVVSVLGEQLNLRRDMLVALTGAQLPGENGENERAGAAEAPDHRDAPADRTLRP